MIFLIITTVVVLALLVALLAVALAATAGRAGDHGPDHRGVIHALGMLRSPSGKPFFAGPGAVSDLTRALDDLREDFCDGGAAGRPPRTGAMTPTSATHGLRRSRTTSASTPGRG